MLLQTTKLLFLSSLLLVYQDAVIPRSDQLRIHLPRQRTVETSTLSLGEVGIVYGPDELVERASGVLLGRVSLPGQQIVLDRAAILSRLASAGISAGTVRFTGAEKVFVTRAARTITAEQLIEAAKAFLKTTELVSSAAGLQVVRQPKALSIADTAGQVRFNCRLSRAPVAGVINVQVTVLVDGKVVGVREVPMRLQFKCRRAIALTDIPAGTVLTTDNVKIEHVLSNRPEPANWKLPYGLVARRPIRAETELRPSMVGPVQPQVVIKRNESVLIRIDRLGLLVTAVGRALQDGHLGQYIRVQNVDSQRIIIAKVKEDGTVEPVY